MLNTANTFTLGPNTFQSGGAANIGLIVRGAASQTANLQEWQDSAGTVLARIESTGKIVGTSDLLISSGVAYFNAAGNT